MGGHAFQLTPDGIVPLEDDPLAVNGAAPPISSDDDDDDDEMPVRVPAPRIIATTKLQPQPKPKPLAPKDVVKLARQRLREVRAELRHLKRLENERDELERLLAAATKKPTKAIVRDLKRA